MSTPSPSAVVLSAKDQWPGTMKLITWLWAHSYAIKPREQHWLFRKLRQQFRVDVSRTVRLRTGEGCSVDPFDFVRGELPRDGHYEATTIDTYVARQNITRIDFLKADVEGAELPLLRGGQASIKRFRPVLVVEGSLHSKGFGYETSELAEFIESNGYQVFLVDEHGLTPRPQEWPPKEYFNILGIPDERIGQLSLRLGLPIA